MAIIGYRSEFRNQVLVEEDDAFRQKLANSLVSATSLLSKVTSQRKIIKSQYDNLIETFKTKLDEVKAANKEMKIKLIRSLVLKDVDTGKKEKNSDEGNSDQKKLEKKEEEAETKTSEPNEAEKPKDAEVDKKKKKRDRKLLMR